jgi:hypothetical protein
MLYNLGKCLSVISAPRIRGIQMNKNQKSPQIASRGWNGDSAFHTVFGLILGCVEKNKYVKHTVAIGIAYARSLMPAKNSKNSKLVTETRQ